MKKGSSCLVIFIVLMCNVAAHAQFKAVTVTRDSAQRIQYLKNKARIQRIINDTSIYFGRGVAKIKNGDIIIAYNKAKKMAQNDLSQSIEIHVKSTVMSIVRDKKINKKEISSSEFKEVYHISTNTHINNPKRYRFKNYPAPGDITYVFTTSITDYKRRLKSIYNKRKSLVTTNLKSGNEAFERSNYMTALNDWSNAKKYSSHYFRNLLQYDCDNNKSIENVNSYLEDKVDNFFSNLSLTFLNTDITYNADGTLNGEKPMVVVHFYVNRHDSLPVKNIPLRIGFIQGNGRLNGSLTTGRYGQVEIPVSSVDASNKTTILSIEIDTSRIAGINEFSNFNLPKARLALNKIKTIAIAITPFKGKSGKIQKDLSSELISKIEDNGFQQQMASVPGNQVTRTDLYNISSKNADYLIFVKINAKSSNDIGGIKNLWISHESGYISLYKLPGGNNEIKRENLSTVKGFGVSSNLSEWDAYYKLKKVITKDLNILISNLK